MIIVCAWCEREGRPALLYKEDDTSLAGELELHSHGICKAHLDQMLSEMQTPFADSVVCPVSQAVSQNCDAKPETLSYVNHCGRR